MNTNLFVYLISLISTCVKDGEPLQCWICSSIYEPACDDPFNPTELQGSIDYFLYDCNLNDIMNGSLEQQHLMEQIFGHEPKTYCRKTVRKAIGITIVHRGCSFGDVPKDCSEGHDDVCHTSACYEDGCNKGTGLTLVYPLYIPVLTLLLLFLL